MIDEVYILDSNFNALGVIDEFLSCIWVERYSRAGDFELLCPASEKTKALLYAPADDLTDRYARIKDSDTVMVIENVLLVTDAEDGDRFTVTGRSVESLLDRRVIWDRYAAQNVTISNVISSLIRQNVTQPGDSGRVIDLFRPSGAAWFLTSSQAAEKRLKAVEYYGENLYDTIVELCEANHIGFRAVPVAGGIQIQLYDGADRTYDQLEYPYVVFSDKFGNLLGSRWQRNTAGVKNYVLVRGDADYDPVFNDGDALLLSTARNNVQAYSGAYQETQDLEAEIKELQRRRYDLKARLAKLYNEPDSVENQLERNGESIEHELEQIEYYLNLRQTALARAKSDFDLWQYWTDVQRKLGDPVKRKMMLCSPAEAVTGLARREMWVDDSTELEKDEETVRLEKQNESYQEQINQLWEDYWGNVDPFSGVAQGNYEETKEQVEALRQQIRMNNSLITQRNRQTLDRYYSQLSETGRLALAEHSVVTSFDGEVDTNVQYHFGKDFFVGDLVQIRNEYGFEAVTRVTEVMRSRDESGDSVIPTFVSD